MLLRFGGSDLITRMPRSDRFSSANPVSSPPPGMYVRATYTENSEVRDFSNTLTIQTTQYTQFVLCVKCVRLGPLSLQSALTADRLDTGADWHVLVLTQAHSRAALSDSAARKPPYRRPLPCRAAFTHTPDFLLDRVCVEERTEPPVCPAAASLGQKIGPRVLRSILAGPEDRPARWMPA